MGITTNISQSLDDKDRRILALVQRDAKLPQAEIARLEDHVQWAFWAWELIGKTYHRPIETWGLNGARLIRRLWADADSRAKNACVAPGAR